MDSADAESMASHHRETAADRAATRRAVHDPLVAQGVDHDHALDGVDRIARSLVAHAVDLDAHVIGAPPGAEQQLTPAPLEVISDDLGRDDQGVVRCIADDARPFEPSPQRPSDAGHHSRLRLAPIGKRLHATPDTPSGRDTCPLRASVEHVEAAAVDEALGRVDDRAGGAQRLGGVVLVHVG